MYVRSMEDEIKRPKHDHFKVRFLSMVRGSPDMLVTLSGYSSPPSINSTTTASYISVPSRKHKLPLIKVVRVSDGESISKKVKMQAGGVYTMIVQESNNFSKSFNETTFNTIIIEDLSPPTVPMIWQALQFLILSLGEVLFSITGLEFAYSQAPHSMKSCIMAGWLLTTSVGNLIVVILEGFKPNDGLAIQFFFFAILLAVVMILFVLMAHFYTYVDYGCESAREENEEEEVEKDDDYSRIE